MAEAQIYKRIIRQPNLTEQLNMLEVGDACEIFAKDYKTYVVRLRCSEIKRQCGKFFTVTEKNLTDRCIVKRIA